MCTRLVLRSVIVLGVATAGIPTLGTLLATPAAAFCLGFRCGGFGGFGFHAGPSMLARPMSPSLAVPANQAARLHVPHSISSTAALRTKTASPNAGSSGTSHHSCPTCRRLTIPKQNNDINPGGPATFVSASPGGSGQGAAGGGNFTSGLASGSGGGGGGTGQFSSASAPGNGQSTTSRALNDPAATSRSSTGGSALTRSQSAPSTTSTATLSAVTVCMTRAGSCPMERDIGSACQCKDTQGNIYDGVVK